MGELEKGLAGVGRYTASAVASIAYKEPVGVVDGNVIRVVSRLRRIGAESTSKVSNEAYWKNANDLVDPDRPGDFNQALMELGATVCTPKNPNCNKCPLKVQCLAFKELPNGKDIDDIENVPSCNLCLPSADKYKQELGVTNYPRKGKKTEVKVKKSLVAIIRNGDRYLLSQRPETGLLANLLEFPVLVDDLSSEEPDSGADPKRVRQLVKSSTSLASFDLQHQGEVLHQFSHIRQTYCVWMVEAPTQDFKWKTGDTGQHPQNLKWLTEEEIGQSAISTAMKKVFKLKDKKPSTPATKLSSQRSITSFFIKKE